MLEEFRKFIARGNVLDLAVGIIIGAAFTAIVNSIVNDLINPVIGLIIGGIDFTNLYWVLSGSVPLEASLEQARASGAAIFAYGSFIMSVINFLIIAFVVFLLVKIVNRVKDAAHRKEQLEAVAAPAVPKGPTQEELLVQIRDLLAQKPQV
ncbi:large conductance mechanosensitive channel protein MscL [Falsirhodobacter deserti]|uniref:large conductance mechanosensitive channel protein MscL n=1 Tax=Falsirhodobacter deserti TaxID=1365611 RepID=UPI000FE3D410|nr:large conductance mechanosensitive channel protein MscL [Falsirhodobacter deserti]